MIFYHAKVTVGGLQLFPGGYLGVDIFFVISGYLITTLLMTELTATGRVSIVNFYERRARRLLPALLIVMLVSMPVAWHYLLPEQLVDFAYSLIFSLFFASNFYWDISMQQYGAEPALLKPFLHTWSLAVEEQYYIFFPLLLFAVYRWSKQHLKVILLSGLVLSLLFAQWMTGRDSSFSFYMMPTRLWELLAGGLLALLPLRQKSGVPITTLHRLLPVAGLLMIIGSLVSFSFDIHHPGFITLIPVLGTVLIIHFWHHEGWVTRLLSLRFMVYLGLLSYSLYLWHYPIFAFGRMVSETPSIAHKVVWVVLTLAMSSVAYHLLEKPFRNRRLVSSKQLVAVLMLLTTIVVGVSLYWILDENVPGRKGYLANLLHSAKTQEVLHNGVNCHSRAKRGEYSLDEVCIIEDFPGAPNLVLVGDSHAGALAASVRALAYENQLNYVQVTQAGCTHIDRGPSGTCKERSKGLRSFLSELRSPIIIYHSRLPLFLELEKFDNQEGGREMKFSGAPGSAGRDPRSKMNEQSLARKKMQRARALVSVLNGWVEDGYRLILIYPVPEQGFHVYHKLKRHSPPIEEAAQIPTLSTSYDVFLQRVASSYAALDKVTGDGLIRVYPEKLFCREASGRCVASEGERLYFGFDNHVTALGSDLIVRQVALELELRVPRIFRK